jgi:chromosome segregation ATPase
MSWFSEGLEQMKKALVDEESLLKENSELRQQNKDLQDLLQNLKQKAAAKIKELERKLDGPESSLKESSGDKGMVEMLQREMQEQKQQFEKNLVEFDLELQGTRQKCEDLLQENSTLQLEKKSLEEVAVKREEELKDLKVKAKVKIEQLKQQLSAKNESSTATLQEKENSMEQKYKGELMQVKSELAEWKNKVQDMESKSLDLTAAEGRVIDLENQLIDLQSKFENVEAALKTDLDLVSKELEFYKEKCQEMNTLHKQELEKEALLNTLNVDSKDFEKRVEQINKEWKERFEKSQLDFADAEKRFGSLELQYRQEIENLTEKYQNLQMDFEQNILEHESKISQLNKALDEASQRANMDLESEWRQKYEDLEFNAQIRLEEKTAELNEAFAAVQNELDMARQQVLDLETANGFRFQEVEDNFRFKLLEAESNSQAEISKLKEMINELQLQLEVNQGSIDGVEWESKNQVFEKASELETTAISLQATIYSLQEQLKDAEQKHNDELRAMAATNESVIVQKLESQEKNWTQKLVDLKSQHELELNRLTKELEEIRLEQTVKDSNLGSQKFTQNFRLD